MHVFKLIHTQITTGIRVHESLLSLIFLLTDTSGISIEIKHVVNDDEDNYDNLVMQRSVLLISNNVFIVQHY